MRGSIRTVLVALALAFMGATVVAHIRLINPSNGAPLFWSNPANVSIVINSDGSDDLPDGSHETALRLAIEEWNSATGTSATLVEDTNPASQARTDFQATDIHLIVFDEDDSSGYFPGNSGTVAITPLWFFGNGQLADADIIFNGDDFQFTTSGQILRFDVQDVGAHEIGHLLGLDHSGFAGSTMYPFVAPTMILHRSISEDDAHGLRDAYPLGAQGQVTGTILRQSNGTPVAGAHVAGRDAAGRTVGGTLTSTAGTFVLRGLDPGTYTVYAFPLDEPVAAFNIGAGHTIETDFEPAVYGTTATITASETVALGTLSVGSDVTLNLGRNVDVYPLRLIDGMTQSLTIRGTGLFPGSTLTASDPDVTLSSISWLGTQVSFQAAVTDGEVPGHIDLSVVNGSGELSVLSGGLEITPPTPTVTLTTPAVGSQSGGNALTITGTGFNPGARVVIGDQIYRDGDVGVSIGVNTINLTTNATIAGTHDVVVLDATGVEGRQANGFQAAAVPVVTSVFPIAGSALGGTSVTLSGGDFQPGVTVRIDGVTQNGIVFESSTRILFTTAGGAAGGPYVLEVENLDAGLASASFGYAAQPDPAPTALDPASGSAGGGQMLMLSGASFTAGAQVVFGVDPDTGLGGVAAPSVAFIDANTLEVLTPAHASGSASVVVLDPVTGQGALVPGGFLFASSGGGGGCYTRPIDTPRGSREVLLGSWWLALLAGVLLALRMRARRAVAVRVE